MDDLNEYLQPKNSPIAQNMGAVSAYDFAFQNERNAVDLTKIKNFSFSSGTGGTLALGGVGNGNGQLVIRDSSGSQIGILNNEGLTITGGNIEVYNSSGSLTFDASGLVSTANFISSAVTKAASFNQSFTSSTPAGLTDGTLSFDLSRQTNILFLADIVSFSSNGDAGTVSYSGNGVVRLNIDGVEQTRIVETGGNDYSNKDAFGGGQNTLESASAHFLTNLAAGTHTYTLTGARDVNFGNPTFTVYKYKMTYIKLGT